MENSNIFIYDLIERYDFNDLNKNTIEQVLKLCSEKEYNALRNAYLKNKKYFSETGEVPVPRKATYSNIYKKESWQHKPVYRIINYSIPLYQVAATIVLLIGITFIFNSSLLSGNSSTDFASVDTVFVKRTDTLKVFIHDTINSTRALLASQNDNFIKSTERDISTEQNSAISYSEMEEHFTDNYLEPGDLEKFRRVKKSKSLANEPVLANFVISIN